MDRKTTKRLNIFLVIAGRATPVPNSSIYVSNVYETLKDMGHDVVLIRFDQILSIIFKKFWTIAGSLWDQKLRNLNHNSRTMLESSPASVSQVERMPC